MRVLVCPKPRNAAEHRSEDGEPQISATGKEEDRERVENEQTPFPIRNVVGVADQRDERQGREQKEDTLKLGKGTGGPHDTVYTR